jgi:hypothetical protein
MGGISKDIDDLNEPLRTRVRRFLEWWKANRPDEISIAVIQTKRSQEVQNAYYAQGREPLGKVNGMRKAAGLYLLSEQENRKIVTRTLSSKHITGDAADIVPLGQTGNILWNAPEAVWEKIGKKAEEFGLDWCAGGGGNAWHWDNPHYELLINFKE